MCPKRPICYSSDWRSRCCGRIVIKKGLKIIPNNCFWGVKSGFGREHSLKTYCEWDLTVRRTKSNRFLYFFLSHSLLLSTMHDSLAHIKRNARSNVGIGIGALRNKEHTRSGQRQADGNIKLKCWTISGACHMRSTRQFDNNFEL